MDEVILNLLKKVRDSEPVYTVNKNTPIDDFLNLTKATQLGLLEAKYDPSTELTAYTLTTEGQLYLSAVDISEALEEKHIYPALFKDIRSGITVLAIGETSGTVVGSSQPELFDDVYPVGTFATNFIPFTNDEQWVRVGEATIKI